MSEKQHPIVALKQPQRPQRSRSPRNNLLLSLKKNDLELEFYSSIDPELMDKLLEKVLSWLIFVTWAKSILFAAEKTVLKPCIGTAKDIGYCINALKTARWAGRRIKTGSRLSLLSRSTG